MRNIFQVILKWVLNAKVALFVTACTIYILLIYFLSDTLLNPYSSIKWEIIPCIVLIICIAIYALNRITTSEQKYRSLYEYHAEAILTINLKGKVTNLNQQYEKLFGYNIEHFTNRSWDEDLSHLTKSQLDMLRSNFFEALRGKSLNFEVLYKHKMGYTIEVSTTLVPMVSNSKIVGLYAICRDITDINQHKAEIERLHKHYQLLLNSVTEGIVGIGVDGKINFWNRTAERILGYSSDEVYQQNFMKFCQCSSCSNLIDQASDKTICQKILQCLSDGQQRVFDEVMLYRKDASTIPTSLIIAPTIQYDGKQIGVVCTFEDITEYRETEELLRKSDRLAAAGQLAAGVAHEIRNPLTALKGFLRLFPKTNLQEHNYVSIMDRELLRIESIVNEFLFVAKPHTSTFELHHLDSILNETIELLNIQALMNSVTITIHYETPLPLIICDAHQLKQVFINVIKNALEAISDDGNIDVHVAHQIEHNRVKIEFEDNGCGIAPERLEQLGEPFYSTKEKGTGLGLMVSYKIIESHGGNITFNSRLNVGTRVEIYLPTPPREEHRKD